jgi:uncharacterized RDD family membrane protein YckC
LTVSDPGYRELANDPAFDMSDPNARYYTGWRRFFAIILDFIFLSIAGYLLMLPLHLLGLSRFFGFFDPEFLLNASYPVLAIWLYGKTLGKKLCGLEVRSWPDEGRVGLSASIMREIIPIALAVLSPLLTLLPEDNGRGVGGFISLAVGFLVVVGYLGWIILEIVTMLLDPQRRAFHDKIAGTVVVKTDPSLTAPA